VHNTVSIIKADVGSLAGHVKVPEELLKLCEASLSRALEKSVIEDFRVMSCGDDTTLPQVIERLKKRFEPVE
jgi:fructose 1,6-bisphosphate aldolase/phosphatase